MTVRVEVPEGCKFCRDCGEVKPVDGNFHMTMRKGKRGPKPYCIPCMRKRWHSWNNKSRGEPVARGRVWVRQQSEAMCDSAFMAWGGGEPRQDWRASL